MYNKERYMGYISMHLRHAKSRQTRKAMEKKQEEKEQHVKTAEFSSA
ncbi:MAG: hypothetical protein QG657_337 [Acidobacteriota bacterium]|nr:hypothetical protein [Acidobacteriota bacterium]